MIDDPNAAERFQSSVLGAQAKITVGFYPDEGLEHTFSALLYYHNRLITPFKYIGAPPAPHHTDGLLQILVAL